MRFPIVLFLLIPCTAFSQLKWTNVDTDYGPLPKGVHLYFTEQRLDTAPFRAFYLVADLKNKKLDFTTDTTYQRRLTPSQFYEKNHQPLVIVNGTFFSFATHQNLNVVVKNGYAVSYNIDSIRVKKGDSTQVVRVIRSALGINKKGKADIAWILNDSSQKTVMASQIPDMPVKGNFFSINKRTGEKRSWRADNFQPWKVETAIGGGPVLVQDQKIWISNDFERMFSGKAINDKHPRTAMGYTRDGKLIILVVEGRNPDASGASLVQLAQIMKDLKCVEALNLDGGGSSCMLVNGKETIRPSDKQQRAVPAVFLIH